MDAQVRRSLPQGLARSRGRIPHIHFAWRPHHARRGLLSPAAMFWNVVFSSSAGGRRFLPNPFVLTLILQSGSPMERAPTPAFAVAMSARFLPEDAPRAVGEVRRAGSISMRCPMRPWPNSCRLSNIRLRSAGRRMSLNWRRRFDRWRRGDSRTPGS